ncbi:hypothetical protein PIB30_061177 [Stylosanthes scabra]|uniref:Uncharacterized protein n=1 Tax=Stylosanthes scabra TaxID=79078 RepID=A0ABU6RKQ2_9FABA|nr:hypothetical protein [Stylosanthes scabra]
MFTSTSSPLIHRPSFVLRVAPSVPVCIFVSQLLIRHCSPSSPVISFLLKNKGDLTEILITELTFYLEIADVFEAMLKKHVSEVCLIIFGQSICLNSTFSGK